jgi:hypothetical protein
VNYADSIAAVDSFTVPTVTFRVLYVFIVLKHVRRHIVHFNVTEHPSAQWVARQLSEVFPLDCAPRYLLRDNAVRFMAGCSCTACSNWVLRTVRPRPVHRGKTAYSQRAIGSIQRECLDHVIVLNERHAR